MCMLLAALITFAEPGFPMLGVRALAEIPGATEARSVDELTRLLQPGNVLVWRHGSAFPAEAWTPLQRFLEAGGSILYIGGEPFTRPVVGPPGARVVQPPTVSLLKALRLNQCYRVPVGSGELRPVDPDGASARPPRTLEADAWAAVLEPRLCDTTSFPHEDGSPGSRDAVLRPLFHVHDADMAARAAIRSRREFPVAAGAFVIDQLRGAWAGGRWVFWLLSDSPNEAELAELLREAQKPAVDFRIEPTLACFHDGERPSVRIRLHRPRAADAVSVDVHVLCTTAAGASVAAQTVHLDAAEHALLDVPLECGKLSPGLHLVRAEIPGLPSATNGFWVFDAELFASGDDLSLDEYTLLRAGKPEPIVGTTFMSPNVHRWFLFEPDVAAWDETFAELADLQINLVRTGVWSGFRAISPEPGAISEPFLRSLEAFYLSARRHGIPVLFTFFAFLPESFGGKNPYLDPRSLDGQTAYVSAIARRFAPAREILWDLINEPSFSSPDQLWKCRPNGDEFEKRAFLEWLACRFGGGAGDANDWQQRVRVRWRLAPDEEIGLPKLEDFEDANVFVSRRPYRAVDYIHFSQDAFADWTRHVSRAIRASGSKTPITVGQDEGGLTQRPSPLFHHDAVDFTSMHTWWLNDQLLFDGLASKAAAKPLLISETGVMQRELLSGTTIREPGASAALLSRKIGLAFASGAFGVVQWCYDVNPYMASDNEAAIGLRRVDGSYKPEHRVMRETAAFVARNRERFQAPRDSDVVLVLPSAEQFSPRDMATQAARRSAQVLSRLLGRGPRVIPEHRLAADMGTPRAIVLPANRGISDTAWNSIRQACRGGAVLIASGWFEADDAGLPAERLGLPRRNLALNEPADFRSQGSDAATAAVAHAPPSRVIRFPLEAVQSWYAAAAAPQPRELNVDGTKAWHFALPLEWSDDLAAIESFYDRALPPDLPRASRKSPAHNGLTVQKIDFQAAALWIFVNESPDALSAALGASGNELIVPAGECRMAFLSLDGAALLDVSSSMQ